MPWATNEHEECVSVRRELGSAVLRTSVVSALGEDSNPIARFMDNKMATANAASRDFETVYYICVDLLCISTTGIRLFAIRERPTFIDRQGSNFPNLMITEKDPYDFGALIVASLVRRGRFYIGFFKRPLNGCYTSFELRFERGRCYEPMGKSNNERVTTSWRSLCS